MSDAIFSPTALRDAVEREVAALVPDGQHFAVIASVDVGPGEPVEVVLGVAARVGNGWQFAFKAGVEIDRTPSPSASLKVTYSR